MAAACCVFPITCALLTFLLASSCNTARPPGSSFPRRTQDRRHNTVEPQLCVCSAEGETTVAGGAGRTDRPAMSKRDIVFVTGNANKLEEVKQIFKNFYKSSSVPFNLTNKNVDLPEHQGERDEICKQKAQAAFKIINGPCIVEDTSLCFNAMGGLPGPYVKWFLNAVGPSGLYCMLKGFEDKTAIAVCTVAYVSERGQVNIFTGKTNGTIVEPTVPEVFGWDSCFKPEGYDITYGQMPKEEKNLISHRLKAFFQLKEFLDKDVLN